MQDQLTCEVCKKEPAVGVACVPGVPYSAAYGAECLRRGADPYGIVRANIACAGGPGQVYPEYLESLVFYRDQYMTIGEALKLEPMTAQEMAGPEPEEITTDTPEVEIP